MGFQDDLARGVRAGACTLFTGPALLFDFAKEVGITKAFGRPGVAGFDPSEAVSNAVDYFCDRPPSGLQPPPGEPGQCPVAYNWELVVTEGFDGVIPDRDVVTSGRSFGPFTLVQGYWRIGSQPEVVGYESASGLDPQLGRGSSALREMTVKSFTPVRVDGQPDDCDDGSNRPPLTQGDRNTEINVGGDNALLSIGKVSITGNGNVVAGIVVVGDTYTFTGDVVFNKNEININVGGKDPSADCCDKEPEEDEEEGEVIGVNVVATITTPPLPPKTTVFFVDGQDADIYAPALGYVKFKTEISKREVWTEDIPIKSLQSYIPWEGETEVIDVAAYARAGVALQLFRVTQSIPNK